MQYMPYCAQGFHELFAQEKSESGRTLERKRDSWEVISSLVDIHSFSFPDFRYRSLLLFHLLFPSNFSFDLVDCAGIREGKTES